jgi:hypothetical protein
MHYLVYIRYGYGVVQLAAHVWILLNDVTTSSGQFDS